MTIEALFSNDELNTIKQQLIQERQRLERSEAPMVQHVEDDSVDIKVEKPINEDEQLNVVALETKIALQDHILESIAQIDFAIQRIDEGQYGICIDCAESIPAKRLEAFPAALRCLNCKQDFEQQYTNPSPY